MALGELVIMVLVGHRREREREESLAILRLGRSKKHDRQQQCIFI